MTLRFDAANAIRVVYFQLVVALGKVGIASNAKRPVEAYRSESEPGTTAYSTFQTFMQNICRSGMGRLPSFSQILYKDFMYFRVRGNYGRSPDGRL